MSPPLQSSPALRLTLCETTDQLIQQPTSILPFGAKAYVHGTDSSYTLYKGVGTIYDTLGAAVVTPADQTNNRWIQEEANGASPWQAIMILNAGINVTPGGQFQWARLGSTPGSFALSAGDDAMFTVDPTSGILSYHGPTRVMNVSFNVSVLAASAATFDCHAAISFDNDIAAGSTSEHRDAGEVSSTVSNSIMQCLSGVRQVVMGNNDTLRLMLRNMSSGSPIEVDYFQMFIRP